MTKLEELHAAFEADTPGEWMAYAFGFKTQAGDVACLLGPDGLRLVSGNFKRDDAKFIALMKNNLPALLEALKVARYWIGTNEIVKAQIDIAIAKAEGRS